MRFYSREADVIYTIRTRRKHCRCHWRFRSNLILLWIASRLDLKIIILNKKGGACISVVRQEGASFTCILLTIPLCTQISYISLYRWTLLLLLVVVVVVHVVVVVVLLLIIIIIIIIVIVVIVVVVAIVVSMMIVAIKMSLLSLLWVVEWPAIVYFESSISHIFLKCYHKRRYQMKHQRDTGNPGIKILSTTQ